MGSGANDTALSVMQALYRAVEQPQLWIEGLTRLADHVGADHVVLDLQSSEVQATGEQLFARVDPVHAQRFSSHSEYANLRHLLTQVPKGVAFHQDRLLDAKIQTRSAFYADVIRPMGGDHAMLALPEINQRGSETAVLAICRSGRRGRFDDLALARLQELLPHFETALRLRRQLNDAAGGAWWQPQVMDALPVAVFLLDAAAVPCHMNRAAQALLARQDFIQLHREQRLVAMSPQASMLLRRAIHNAANGHATSRGEFIRLSSDRTTVSLQARIVPVDTEGAMQHAWHLANVALICDARALNPLNAESLVSAFGFTARELEVAQVLAQGGTLAAVSTSLGIQLETTRTHLKNLFVKTGCSRQVDLVRVLETHRAGI